MRAVIFKTAHRLLVAFFGRQAVAFYGHQVAVHAAWERIQQRLLVVAHLLRKIESERVIAQKCEFTQSQTKNSSNNQQAPSNLQ